MSDKQKKQKKNDNSPRSVNIVLPNTISDSDFQRILVESLLAYDKAKQDLAVKAEEEALQERRQQIGYKDYSNKKAIIKFFLTIFNRIVIFFKTIFMSKSKIKGDFATSVLIKSILSGLFKFLAFALWIVAIGLVFSYPISLGVPNLISVKPFEYPILIGFGLLSIIFAQLFRMAGIEIEKMKDNNYIVSILSVLIAVIALLISLLFR